jgi:putative addiction module component (TIGR02574 family)
MPSIPDDLEKAALALPPEQRAQLIQRLIASLDDPEELSDAWRDEIQKRLDAYKRGDLDSIPADDLLTDLRNQLES